MTEVPQHPCDHVGCAPFAWHCETVMYYAPHHCQSWWLPEQPGISHYGYPYDSAPAASRPSGGDSPRKGLKNVKLQKPGAALCAEESTSESAAETEVIRV